VANEIRGTLSAGGLKVAVVASRFNQLIVDSLVRGASEAIVQVGGSADHVTVYWVPGAFEVPQMAQRLVDTGRYDAVVCLGAVIRGATPHFDYVAGACANGVARVAQVAAIPVSFGVLTTETIEQALERAGTKAGNKGYDAAMAAIEMVSLLRATDK